MPHLPSMITDLALILIVAGIMTLAFRAIRQPVVLGYILAGLLVGPNVRWIPSIADVNSVKVWADIGVIFLLFALGLDFSFKKLIKVGGTVAVTASVEVAAMVGIGFLVGKAFGWSQMDSLFLGGLLAISSTTIIYRALDDLGLKARNFAHVVFGVLIIEDLFAVLLMVGLTTVAVSQKFSGLAMGVSALKLGFFLTVWFVLGIVLVPTFLKNTRHLLGSETLLILSVGLCFLMVVLASKVGFSPALGAFVMGSILAETIEGERIGQLIAPVKDLFAAIFFVSVGMLIDPEQLLAYATPIFVITIVTIFGKILTTTMGALLSGQSLTQSVRSGLCLAQIGEFSFIIAALGVSLKVTSDFLYPVAISVCAITAFTTPYLIRSADPTVAYLERALPRRWLSALETFSRASATVSYTSDWRDLIRKATMKLTANAVAVIAIFLLIASYLPGQMFTEPRYVGDAVSLLVAVTLSSPFIWALSFGRISLDSERNLWREKRYRPPLLVFQAARWLITIMLIAVLASHFVTAKIVAIVATLSAVIIVVSLSRHLSRVYLWLEQRFVVNLNGRQDGPSQALPLADAWKHSPRPILVTADTPYAHHTIRESGLRQTSNELIVAIEKQGQRILNPDPSTVIEPGDTLWVIGAK